eukprot:4513269-Pyramimonas_sp.AAC.1
MTEFFESCVTLYAQLTDTDPAAYPAAGTPFGPEFMTSKTAKAALELTRGPPDQEIEVHGLGAAAARPNDPEPPTQSGVLQPIAAK